MEFFSIRTFRPFETKSENTDQDRPTMRLLDGLLALPIGALSSGPEWKQFWGIDDLPTLVATALSGANNTKAHFVTITRGNHVVIVVWSLSLSKPLGCFYVTAGTLADYDFDSTTSVTVASTNNSVYRDKDGSAPWFASRIANRWYFGNGIDDNVQWSSGALSLLGPASPPAASDIYNMSRVKIPPCTSFVMAGNKSIFAAGNAASPKRVWITHPPTSDFPFNEGIHSLSTSFIDLTYSEATKITALTAFNNYITAHTDVKPVNLFDVDGSSDGWKCVQAPSAANSSAPSPAAVRDTNGIASFYVGADGEIYEDQSIRVGPHDKRPARNQDIATRLAADDWNRDMCAPVGVGKVHTVYDRTQQMFWIFAELDAISGRFGLWAFNERTSAPMGPFTHIDALVSAAIPGPTQTFVVVVTSNGEMLYSDLSNIGEVNEFMNEEDDVPLWPEFEVLDAEPTPTPGLSYVAMTADNRVFKEVISGGSSVLMVDPWSYFDPDDAFDFTFTKFFKDAHIARFETGYLDFGNAEVLKNYLELRITFQHHSRAYLGLYAESDGSHKKLRGGKWYGLVFNRETHRVPINLIGRRVRVRGVVVLFNAAPAMIRDVSIGWLPAGPT